MVSHDAPCSDPPKRCLIVERHVWETGSRQQQLQFVLETAANFFGPGDIDREIEVRVFLPPNAQNPTFAKKIVISREYHNRTRRMNHFPEMGSVPTSFVFFEQTDQPNVYNLWWQEDKAVVAAKYNGWSQGKKTQYGRGRLSIIVPAPVPWGIDRID